MQTGKTLTESFGKLIHSLPTTVFEINHAGLSKESVRFFRLRGRVLLQRVWPPTLAL